jgi:uncharacterized low-complexity protein
MKKMTKTPLAAAMGVALMSTFAATAANAEANPFGASELSQGYMQLAEADKAGEMKCGAGMQMEKPKTPEGACAGKKTDAAKPADGKAVEAACGAGMAKDKEGACGAGMKTPETKPEAK